MPRRKPEQATQLKFRVEPPLREELEKSAKASGRSLNAEITERLADSVRPKRYWQTVDNPKVNAIIDLLAQIIYAAGQNAGGFATLSYDGSAWCDNAYAYDQATKAAALALRAMRPTEEIEAPSLDADAGMYSRMGEVFARAIMKEVVSLRHGDTALPERIDRAERLRPPLGDIVDRIKQNLERDEP
jgi:hypothetical protein